MSTYAELQVGSKGTFEKTISETDVYLFAGISGDFNPAHVNEVKAQKSMFKGRIVHGYLTASFISTVIGTRMPGEGTIYLSQSFRFLKPVRVGDTIRAEVTVIDKLEKGRLRLDTKCFNQDGEIVVDGEGLVIAPRE